MRKTRLNWREVSEKSCASLVQARHQRRGAGRGITDGDIELVGRHLHLANQHLRIGQQGADPYSCDLVLLFDNFDLLPDTDQQDPQRNSRSEEK